MMFAPRHAAVVEFEHTPHVDRVIGAIGMALDMDYWLVPQVRVSFGCLVRKIRFMIKGQASIISYMQYDCHRDIYMDHILAGLVHHAGHVCDDAGPS